MIRPSSFGKMHPAFQIYKAVIGICKIYIFLYAIVKLSYSIYWFQTEDDYSNLPLAVVLFAISIFLVSVFHWATYMNRKSIYKWVIFVSLLPLCQAMAFFAMGIYLNDYGYEEFLLNLSVDEEDIPFWSRVLAFMWILLCSIPPVTFYFLYKTCEDDKTEAKTNLIKA